VNVYHPTSALSPQRGREFGEMGRIGNHPLPDPRPSRARELTRGSLSLIEIITLLSFLPDREEDCLFSPLG